MIYYSFILIISNLVSTELKIRIFKIVIISVLIPCVNELIVEMLVGENLYCVIGYTKTRSLCQI